MKRRAPRKLDSTAIGTRSGRLVVLSIAESDGKTSRVLARCDCGAQKTIRWSAVARGRTQSCGCLSAELAGERLGEHQYKHGHARSVSTGKDSPEYRVWMNMIQRCTNPKRASFKRYGGRGISVCERWRDSFEAFLSDVGARPSLQHSLDRYPNRNGNYEPGNVRWATLCMSEWARRRGVPVKTLQGRLDRGVPLREALKKGRAA